MQLALDRSFAAGVPVRRYDSDGRLRTVANISKAVVSPYQGDEIPGWEALGLAPGRTYQLLRDPAELRKAAGSFNGIPLLLRHRQLQANDHAHAPTVGTIGDVRMDGPYLTATVTVWDAKAIAGIESGDQRELSCGYSYRPIMRPGIFQGQRYDGKMIEIKGNHVALVDVGRAGRDCAL
jgi:uncharacterized protein